MARWRNHPFARSVVVVFVLAAVLFVLSAEAIARPSAPASTPQRAIRATAMEAVGELEHDLWVELNALRRQAGMRPLRRSHALARAAAHHSRAMGRLGFFSHRSANGSAFWQRVERFYRRPSGFEIYAIGENLLRGGPFVHAGTVLRHWLSSPSHRRNVYGNWREVGFGVVRVHRAPGVYGGLPVAIVTADFGRRG